MPISVTKTASQGQSYASPFLSGFEHTIQVKVDVSALTSREVDADGYLKPGVPFTRAGVLPTAAGNAVVMVSEAVKIHTNNTTLAAVTNDPLVTCVAIGVINRAIIEDNLGAALTAGEIAAIDGAGSRLVMTNV